MLHHGTIQGIDKWVRESWLKDLQGAGVKVADVILWGQYAMKGWDIQRRWAITSDLQCWLDDAMSGTFKKVHPEKVLNEVRHDFEVLTAIRVVLGMDPPEPPWMAEARAAGWTPPSP